MTKICTSIEQSKKLIELGLDVNTADMLWQQIYDENHMLSDYRLELIPYRFYSYTASIPAWSLSALLELMPPIAYNYPIMARLADLSMESKYFLQYVDLNVSGECKSHHTGFCSTPLDAAFEMIIWLLENNYLLC